MNKKSYTLVEIMMILVIIALLASLVLPNITIPLKHAKLARKRAWVKSIISGFESFYTDHDRYPGNLGDIAGAVPAYVRNSDLVYCGYFASQGGLIVQYTCGMDNPNFYYQVSYTEEDAVPVVRLAYYEARVKQDYSLYGCTIKAGGVYFYEMLDGQVIRTACGQ